MEDVSRVCLGGVAEGRGKPLEEIEQLAQGRVWTGAKAKELGLVDELLVVDDHSSDDTGPVAADAGAKVVVAADILPEIAGAGGKGEALWRSLHASSGDIVLWCDADITDIASRFVVGLLGPLLTDPGISFVKGFYERPRARGVGGGRTTELMARPVIATLFPHLSSIVQPLSGEYGGRRELLEQLPFVRGYGVEMGMLVDVAEAVGVKGMAQVDLGTRIHRNRDLDDLGPQALVVLQTALDRAAVRSENPATLVRPGMPPLVPLGPWHCDQGADLSHHRGDLIGGCDRPQSAIRPVRRHQTGPTTTPHGTSPAAGPP